jgi:hypothetical protein
LPQRNILERESEKQTVDPIIPNKFKALSRFDKIARRLIGWKSLPAAAPSPAATPIPTA